MDPKEWLAKQVALGRADKHIAEELGITTTAVGYWRRKFQILPRPTAERAKTAIKETWPQGRRGPEAGHWKGGRSSTSGKKPGGYIRIYMPDHPQANRNGYVYEHRYVMEQKIGRYLEAGELVDHIDRNRSNNAPENLRLHASRSEHVKDHFSARDQLVKVLKKLARYEALYGPLPED